MPNNIQPNSSHNQRLNNLFATIEVKLEKAKTTEDLIAIIEEATRFNAPLKYENGVIYLILGITVMISIIIISIWPSLFTLIPAFMVNLAIFQLTIQRNKRASELSNQIFHRNVVLDNNLTLIDYNPAEKAIELGHYFNDFRRGNYSREVEEIYRGCYPGKEYAINYHYYHFHYVNQTTSRDSDGHTDTNYHHYDRYGIYLDYPFIRGIAIVSRPSNQKSRSIYQPASIVFNERFDIFAESEQQAARFLKPALVLALETLSDQFHELTLEFTDDHKLCISFDDNDLLFSPSAFDLTEPQGFIAEMKAHSHAAKLDNLLQLVDLIITHSDSNFEKHEIKPMKSNVPKIAPKKVIKF